MWISLLVVQAGRNNPALLVPGYAAAAAHKAKRAKHAARASAAGRAFHAIARSHAGALDRGSAVHLERWLRTAVAASQAEAGPVCTTAPHPLPRLRGRFSLTVALAHAAAVRRAVAGMVREHAGFGLPR